MPLSTVHTQSGEDLGGPVIIPVPDISHPAATVMSTSTSESLPCTATENDPPTTDMEIAIKTGGTQVDVGNGELDASTTSSRRTYSREKKLQVLKFLILRKRMQPLAHYVANLSIQVYLVV